MQQRPHVEDCEQLLSTFACIGDGVVIIDLEEQVTFLNKTKPVDTKKFHRVMVKFGLEAKLC